MVDKKSDGIFINTSRRPKLRQMLQWLMERHGRTSFADVAYPAIWRSYE
ncbi:hypothetical protein [Bradyrhizobium sp. McL0616]